MIAACARAMPSSNSASCWAEICMGCLLATDGSIAAMFSWKRPDNLGVKNGRLAPCKRTPNCVSSQADPADREHYIAPLSGPFKKLRQIVESMRGATIIRSEANYLYAEFRTPLMRFVDDVELFFDG